MPCIYYSVSHTHLHVSRNMQHLGHCREQIWFWSHYFNLFGDKLERLAFNLSPALEKMHYESAFLAGTSKMALANSDSFGCISFWLRRHFNKGQFGKYTHVHGHISYRLLCTFPLPRRSTKMLTWQRTGLIKDYIVYTTILQALGDEWTLPVLRWRWDGGKSMP